MSYKISEFLKCHGEKPAKNSIFPIKITRSGSLKLEISKNLKEIF